MADTLEFLRQVLPSRGRYCHAVKIHGYKGFRHKFISTREELAVLQQRDGAKPGRDVYFALGGLGDQDNRTGANVLFLRSLWLDIDCGPGKDYASQDDGLAALDDFLDTGFPDYTLLVSSGYGVHAYWVLEDDALIGDWLPTAQAFKQAWQAHGLKADPSRTADAASVLRAPGTWNRKHEPARAVEVMEDTGARYTLAALRESAATFCTQPLAPVIPASATPADPTANDDLMAGLPGRQSWLSAIVKRCGQVRAVAQNQGRTCAEPMWYATVQLCRHMVNPGEAAHYMSAGHPEYTPAAVDQKLAQLEAKDIGPTTCQKFASLNPAGCENCKWKVTSPIQLGEKDPEPVRAVAQVQAVEVQEDGQVAAVTKNVEPPVEPPEGYMYTADGTMAQTLDAKGLPTWKRIFPGLIWPTRVFRGPGRPLEMEVFSQRQGTGETRMFNMAAAKVGEPRDVRNELLANIMIEAGNAPLLQRLLNGMAMGIQNRSMTDLSVRQMGWQLGDPRTKQQFIFGRNRITPTGIERGIVVDDSLGHVADRLCMPDGSLDGALAGARLLDKRGAQMHQAVYLTGLIGCFAPFTGEQNFAVLSLVSRIGGEGKTTMCDAAMSHWFSPPLVRNSPRDTANALYNTMSIRGTLPVFIDEVTNAKPDQAVDLVYTASQGREKARMDQMGTRTRDPLPPWKAPLLVTANTSIKQLVRVGRGDASALDARVFEIQFQRLDLDPSESKLIGRVFYDNYGWTGPAMAQHVARNLETYAKTADLLRDKLVESMGRDQADRFWLNWGVGVLLAARAMQVLGWVNYGLTDLFVYVQTLLMKQRMAKAAELRTCADILAEFLAEFAGRIIVAYRVGQREDVSKMVTVNEPYRAQSLVGRSQLDEHILYITASSMREFCSTRGYDYRSFLGECEEYHLLARTRVVSSDANGKALVVKPEVPSHYSLGRGTALASAPSKVLAFNLDHVALKDHLNDAGAAVQVHQDYKIAAVR